MELLEILRNFDGALQVIRYGSSFAIYDPRNEELSQTFTRLSLRDISLQDIIPSCYLDSWYDFMFNEMLPNFYNAKDEQINYIQKVVDCEGVGGFSRACQDVGLSKLSLQYRDISDAFLDSSKIRITYFRSKDNLEKKNERKILLEIKGQSYHMELIANNVGNRYLKAHTYFAFNSEHPEESYDLMVAQEIDDMPFFMIRPHKDLLEYGSWKSIEKMGLQFSEIQALEEALIEMSDFDVQEEKEYLKTLLIEYLQNQNTVYGNLDDLINNNQRLDSIVKDAYETYALVRHKPKYTPEIALSND